MNHAAERMKGLGKHVAAEAAPSSIFGSALTLAAAIDHDADYRIAVYPFLWPDEPDVAMGLAACLCYLLEQAPGCQVYRCVARIDGDDDSGEISSGDYQFAPDDWTLDGLDDNVLLNGEIARDDEGTGAAPDAGPVAAWRRRRNHRA